MVKKISGFRQLKLETGDFVGDATRKGIPALQVFYFSFVGVMFLFAVESISLIRFS